MKKSSIESAAVKYEIDFSNLHDFEFSQRLKLSANGKFVYVKRTFSNGQVLCSRYDNDDPGENEEPVTLRAYTAVRGAEVLG